MLIFLCDPFDQIPRLDSSALCMLHRISFLIHYATSKDKRRSNHTEPHWFSQTERQQFQSAREARASAQLQRTTRAAWHQPPNSLCDSKELAWRSLSSPACHGCCWGLYSCSKASKTNLLEARSREPLKGTSFMAREARASLRFQRSLHAASPQLPDLSCDSKEQQ